MGWSPAPAPPCAAASLGAIGQSGKSRKCLDIPWTVPAVRLATSGRPHSIAWYIGRVAVQAQGGRHDQ
jgi:hypothetical protein